MTTRLEQIKARLDKHGGCTNSDLAALLRLAEAAERWEEARNYICTHGMEEGLAYNNEKIVNFVEQESSTKALEAAARAFREEGGRGMTTEDVAKVVYSHYIGQFSIPPRWPNEIASLALLRNVGVRCGWNVHIQISGANEPGGQLYCVCVRSLAHPDCGGYHCAATLPVAALHCAHAAIPFDNSKQP